jgi:hypothetical protein
MKFDSCCNNIYIGYITVRNINNDDENRQQRQSSSLTSLAPYQQEQPYPHLAG